MSPFALPVKRPVATSMLFVGLVLLGVIGWQRIPVELLPEVEGNWLFVNFLRPASEPEVVEREILLPLSARVSELPDVDETWGNVRGSGGRFDVRFDPDTDLKVRELELRRVAAELVREQPPGSVVDVQAIPFGLISRFTMTVAVTGRDDLDVLRHFIEERIEPRLAAVPGVSQVAVVGGASREVTIRIDPDRCAMLGTTPREVTVAIQRAVGRQRYLGGTEDEAGRTAVVLDGRTPGLNTLANARITPERNLLLRHVAEVELGGGRRSSISLINGEQAVSIYIFKDEGANLVSLGRAMRVRLVELGREFAPFGIGFAITADGAELVEDNLNRLKTLAGSGFLIALLVLFLFLRQWRAVSVAGGAVPVSLLAALALLYLSGQTLNLVTIFGLAVGVGMLVDNSIVVYEAVQRRLERGSAPDDAAEAGVRSTVRAILAASITTIIVFLPISFVDFDDAAMRRMLQILTLAIVLPLVGSVVVAVGLVPLLARRLAAPAALLRLARLRRRREALAGKLPPDRFRELFGGLLRVALRRPAGWLTGVAGAVLLTAVIALPWVGFNVLSQEAPEANPVRLAVELPSEATLERAVGIVDRLEQAVRTLDGIERVEATLRENRDGLINGVFSVSMVERDQRPEGVNAASVREVVRQTVRDLRAETRGLQVRNPEDPGGEGGGSGGGGGVAGLLGQGPAEVVLSGPDADTLSRLAREIGQQLGSIPEIESTSVSARRGQDEIHVLPEAARLASFGLLSDEVIGALGVIGREGARMQIGYTDLDGREIPMYVRSESDRRGATQRLREMRVSTQAGVLPVSALSTVRRMPSPPTIQHHNGRREISVHYRFGRRAPQTGPARLELEDRVEAAIQGVHRPAGYTVETPAADDPFDWFKRILVPVVLLLFAVLAITFESLTLPLLVLISLPLTLLGATWALVFTGTPAGPMALVGALALVGLTVNPAILLVDRMQRRVRTGRTSAGGAALAAVRERVRPVLMTTATTVAGLWPLALVTGAENEIWPPFATVVMGGLVTSTVLTLLVMPVGFVMLNRLDQVFGRLGPWIMIGWVGATAALMTPLIVTEQITSMTWRIITTVLVAGVLLGGLVLAFRRPERPEPRAVDGPPVLDVRYLKKIYGQPGPIAYAWRLPELFAKRVLARGGRPFDPADARARIAPLAMLILGAGYLAWTVATTFWHLVFLFATAVLGVFLTTEVRRGRGEADAVGRVLPGGPEGVVAFLLPWIAVGYVVVGGYLFPRLALETPDYRLWFVLTLPVVVGIIQQGRRTALRLARGGIRERLDEGRLRRPRSLWRKLSRRVFGLDLPREEVEALSRIHFTAERGMIGILGPNGAGKTTLLRQLAGILDPSLGRITLGGVPLGKLRRYLARFVGYLPQDFGLPANLTAREYLDYYALLYEMRPAAKRRTQVDRLLEEVGLGQRADERIGSYSGGMRQRVAVARTLLRLPPIIIVDEPTVGLDPRERIRFRNLLARLGEGRIVLFSTHVVEDVAVACERVIVLARGRMVFDGPPADLSGEAEGQVWKARLSAEEQAQLPVEAKIVDQVPEGDGRSRLRILCDRQPHSRAEPETPSLEDGYLVLTGSAPEGDRS